MQKLTLIGAGPGDKELITVKGVRALQQADVILYDALANDTLLNFTSATAIKIFVGKRAGCHSLNQSEINKLIIDSIYNYGNVVRLKGGDPVVFGRGYEEVDYVQAFGIETEIISGISSCIAVPTSQNIPLTRRGISESFWVMTGHTKSGNLPKDIRLAAQSSATVVILMGTSNLPKLTAIFKEYGKSELPVAVIQDGTLPTEQCVTGTVQDIAHKFSQKKSTGPAIIVFGEVVSLHPEFIKNYASEILTNRL